MNIILSILSAIVIAYIFTLAAKKLCIPSVVALILAGITINLKPISDIIIGSNIDILVTIGDFGLLCLMFIAGLEISWRGLYREKDDSIIIAVVGSIISLLLGFIAGLMLGFPVIISLIIGICMSITAEATKARVLIDLNMIKTRVASAMMGAGIIDDIMGLVMFSGAIYLLKETFVREDFMIAGAILAFFIGIFVHYELGRHHMHVNKLEKAIMIAIVPFFFISIGISFSINSLIINPVILLTIIPVAFLGKLFGTLIVKPLVNFSWRQLHLIGWAMNSRGAVEMALALIAFRSGIIPPELYSSLILMALATTLTFPFIITYMIRKDPKIMR